MKISMFKLDTRRNYLTSTNFELFFCNEMLNIYVFLYEFREQETLDLLAINQNFKYIVQDHNIHNLLQLEEDFSSGEMT